MDDLLKLLTAHLARRKSNTSNDIRAIDDAKRRDYVNDQQIGDNLKYWPGLLPADTSKYDEFKRTLLIENIIGPGLNRFVFGMFGRDWDWSASVADGEPLRAEEDEKIAAGAKWHKDANLWGVAKDFARDVLTLEKGASFRLYIPDVFQTEEKPVTMGSAADWPAAFDLIYVMSVPSTADTTRGEGEGGALRDEHGREVGYYYLYSVPDPADPSKTETRLELHGPQEIAWFKVDGDKYVPLGTPVPNPFYDKANPNTRRHRFLMIEAQRDGGSMVTPTAIDLQNDYNVTLSNRRRNSDRAGHRQFVTIDVTDPEDEAGNAMPYTLSGRMVLSLKSLTHGPDGVPLTDPMKASIQVFDPVDTGILNSHLDSTKSALLAYYDQLWTLQGEASGISGESRRESRTAFERRVRLEAEPISQACGTLVERAFQLAAALCGQQSEVEGLSVNAKLPLDSQPVDLLTYQALELAYQGGTLDLETLIENQPVAGDSGERVKRILSDRASNPHFLAKQRELGLPEGAYLRGLQRAGLGPDFAPEGQPPVLPDEAITRAEELAAAGAEALGGEDGGDDGSEE